jgi:hypothetical protein
MNLKGSYAYGKASPPPPAASLRPKPSIQEEFLRRIAVKHAKGVKGGDVRAAKADKIGAFDPNRAGDSEVIVLDGGSSTVPLLGGHNRDQGGKPVGAGKVSGNGKKK